MNSQERWYATGRRKTAVARVWMTPGEGRMQINRRAVEDFFSRRSLRKIIEQPMMLTGTLGQFDYYILTDGGGVSGQADAIRHGISRALQEYNPAFRTQLKRAGFLTRDARKKERKKYGQKGARARYQYSKR